MRARDQAQADALRGEPSPRTRLERWLALHRRATLAVLLSVACLLRGALFLELDRGPCLVQHRWEQSDMHFFDAWARDIAAGDWLSAHALHPYLEWHRTIARDYLRAYPQEAQRLALPSSDPERALWQHWYGDEQFHQEPLYPYLIAATYVVFGPDPRWVFAWQLGLGVLGTYLIVRIARRAFGELAGVLSGVLALCCAPLLFYELLLLRTALCVFFALLLVDLCDRALEDRRGWRWWALGACFGAALLLNSTFAPFGAGVLALLAYRHRTRWTHGARAAAAFVAGALVCLLPAYARNARVGAPLFSTSSVGAITFICANTGDYDPELGFAVGSAQLLPILRSSDDRLLPAALATLATHPGPASYLRQLWSKWSLCWHWYEKPNNENLYYFRLHSALLRWMPVTFLVLAPLALVGLVLGARRGLSCAPLYVLVATALVPLLAFYVLSRFRAPLVAASIPFAALALVELCSMLARRTFVRAAALAVTLALLSLWTMRPLPKGTPLIRRADYTAPFATYYGPESEAALADEDWRRAAALLAEYLRVEAPAIAKIGSSAGLRGARPDELELVQLAVRVRRQHARALRALGEEAAAVAQEERAAELLRAARS